MALRGGRGRPELRRRRGKTGGGATVNLGGGTEDETARVEERKRRNAARVLGAARLKERWGKGAAAAVGARRSEPWRPVELERCTEEGDEGSGPEFGLLAHFGQRESPLSFLFFVFCLSFSFNLF